jgi:acyl-coenzyme A thioesterase PaaI-like protein
MSDDPSDHTASGTAAQPGVLNTTGRTGPLVHGGRITQVWDTEVTAEATGAVIAMFRCTQMVLYPRA